MRKLLTAVSIAVLVAVIVYMPPKTDGQGRLRRFSAIAPDVPVGMIHGETWYLEDSLGTLKGPYIYSDSLTVSLGPEIWIEFGHANSAYSGMLRCNPRILGVLGTTGWQADGGTYRIMQAIAQAANSPTCTSHVYAESSLVASLVWNVGPYTVWTPKADSSAGWLAPAARVVLDSAEVLTVTLGTGVPNPDQPRMQICLREEITH